MSKQVTVYVGGAMTRARPDGFAEERDRQINLAMEKLYSEGCRRMRAVKLLRNGDYDRYRVMGW